MNIKFYLISAIVLIPVVTAMVIVHEYASAYFHIGKYRPTTKAETEAKAEAEIEDAETEEVEAKDTKEQ